MHAHLFRLTRTALMSPYTLHAFTAVLWLAFIWIAYHRQSLVAVIAIGPAYHLFTVVNHRMCEAGYYGTNPFKGGRK